MHLRAIAFPKAKILALGLAIAWMPGVAYAQEEGSSLTPKQAQKLIKKVTSQRLKYLKKDLKASLNSFCDALDLVEEGLKNGSIQPYDAAFEVSVLGGLAALGAQQNLDSMMTLIEIAASSYISQIGGTPLGFLMADCGTLAVAKEKAEAEVAKHYAKIFKKLKKFFGKQAKKEDNMLFGMIDPPDPMPINPGGAPPAPPLKPLKVDSRASGSPTGASNQGKLCIGGTADPLNGATVDVTIVGPNGTPIPQTMINIDGNCRWRVCFPADSGMGNLPSGNYDITIDQNGHKITSNFSVP